MIRTKLKGYFKPSHAQALLAVERQARIAAKYLRNLHNLLRSNKSVFDRIYISNRWGNQESVSGDASTLNETQLLRSRVATLVRELEVRSLLDVPCGDFNWMKLVDLGDVEYTGIDVVSGLIARNNEQFGTSAHRFICADAELEPLLCTDLVLCRDLMVHLPNRSVIKLIQNLQRTGSRYLLATTFPRVERNEDIIRGMWRPINLERPPFLLPPPLRVLFDETTLANGKDKSLGLWRLQDLTVGEVSG